MILADTSIWIYHLRQGHGHLRHLLEEETVVIHPFITGELACGNLKHRKEILLLLGELPQSTLATHEEILEFIEAKNLMGIGLGLVDVHLLASALLDQSFLWTLDKPLHSAAQKLNIAYQK